MRIRKIISLKQAASKNLIDYKLIDHGYALIHYLPIKKENKRDFQRTYQKLQVFRRDLTFTLPHDRRQSSGVAIAMELLARPSENESIWIAFACASLEQPFLFDLHIYTYMHAWSYCCVCDADIQMYMGWQYICFNTLYTVHMLYLWNDQLNCIKITSLHLGFDE